ncbi:MAG TPA: lysylphosphatidylglycerol synthase domain-containing protein [Rudaea sp.]
MRRAASLLIAAALIAALAVPLLIGGKSTFVELGNFPAADFLLIITVALAGWVFRAAKFGCLMHRLNLRVPPWRVGAISLATEFGFLATPGGVGGYAAGVYYLRRAGATLSGAGSITAADQLLDLLFFAAALPLALFALVEAPLPAAVRDVAAVSAGSVFVAIIVLVGMRRRIGRWLFASDGPLVRIPRLRRHIVALAAFGADCDRHLRELARGGAWFMAALLACTAGQWMIRYGLLWLILERLGHPVPFSVLLLLQGVVLHAAQWTGLPSGAGGADLGLAATLVPWISAEHAASALCCGASQRSTLALPPD